MGAFSVGYYVCGIVFERCSGNALGDAAGLGSFRIIECVSSDSDPATEFMDKSEATAIYGGLENKYQISMRYEDGHRSR